MHHARLRKPRRLCDYPSTTVLEEARLRLEALEPHPFSLVCVGAAIVDADLARALRDLEPAEIGHPFGATLVAVQQRLDASVFSNGRPSPDRWLEYLMRTAPGDTMRAYVARAICAFRADVDVYRLGEIADCLRADHRRRRECRVSLDWLADRIELSGEERCG